MLDLWIRRAFLAAMIAAAALAELLIAIGAMTLLGRGAVGELVGSALDLLLLWVILTHRGLRELAHDLGEVSRPAEQARDSQEREV